MVGNGVPLLWVWLLLGVGGTALTLWLVRRVWRHRAHSRPVERWLAALVAAMALVSLLGTLAGIIKMFGAIGGESVDPSQKARILAEGISEAMNFTALGLALWIPSAIASYWLTRVEKRSRKS